MADKKEVEKVLVTIDEFLAGLDADPLLKDMFYHFYGVVKGVKEQTAEEFAALFEMFKHLPASEL